MKIMGAILNPIFHSELRMIEAHMCTAEQYEAGKVELLDRMERFYERQLEIVSDSDGEAPAPASKYDTIIYNSNHQDDDSPSEKAEKEFKKYCQYKQSVYQPKMEPKKKLGAIDEDGQPKEPVYELGPVLAGGRGKDLPSKRNHADYISGNGHYDIVRYLVDHKKYFPALYSVGLGECCPHLSTEVDCESLFSQAGFKSQPRRTQTDICNYEHLVVTKHWMGRINIPPIKVQNLFLQRWRDKSWKECDERDDKEFLEIEKEIYLEHFPNMVEQVKSEEEVQEENNTKGKEAIEVDNKSDGGSNESSESESSRESGSHSSSGSDAESYSNCDDAEKSSDTSLLYVIGSGNAATMNLGFKL